MELQSKSLADRVAVYIAARGHVTFAELERTFPEICGRETLTFKYDTVVLWTNLTAEFIETLKGLLKTKRIHMWDATGAWCYMLDGKVLTLPEIKSVRAYK